MHLACVSLCHRVWVPRGWSLSAFLPTPSNSSSLARNRWYGKRGDSRAKDERTMHTSHQPFWKMVTTPCAMGRNSGPPQHRGLCQQGLSSSGAKCTRHYHRQIRSCPTLPNILTMFLYHKIYHTRSAGCTKIRTPAILLTRKRQKSGSEKGWGTISNKVIAYTEDS